MTWISPKSLPYEKKFIPETKRRKFLAGSLLDEEWLKELTRRPLTPVFFMAAGVLYYFEAEQMKVLFRKLADRFPGSELIFDAASPLGVKVANQKVIKEGGMDESSVLKWGLESAGDLKSWDHRLQIIAEYPMFKKMKQTLPIKLKIGTLMSDRMNIMYLIQVKFKG
jgi:O-methyltransferase involved in polyketide biosynthesis